MRIWVVIVSTECIVSHSKPKARRLFRHWGPTMTAEPVEFGRDEKQALAIQSEATEDRQQQEGTKACIEHRLLSSSVRIPILGSVT